MPFGSANRVSLHRVKEVTWGTTPSNPVMKTLRYTGEAIDDSIDTQTSQEIRSDRMTADLVLVDSSPGGSFNFELSYDAYDDLLESLMMSTWGNALAIVGAAADITATSGTNILSSSTGSKFLNVLVGQWIKLSGFSSSSGANNGYYLVTAKADNQTLTLSPNIPVTETPTGTNAKVDGQLIRNGVTEASYTFLKRFEDLTAVTYHYFTGMRVGSMSLELATGSIVTGQFGLMGKDSNLTETQVAGSTYTAATTKNVMNAVSNVQNILQDTAAFGTTGAISQLTMEVNNNHREQKGIGALGNVGIVAGTLSVTMNASLYFESKAQYEKFKQQTSFRMSFRLQDGDGNAYIVTLPKCKYESMTVNSSQIDSDVAAEASIRAILDSTTSCMIQIDKFAAA